MPGSLKRSKIAFNIILCTILISNSFLFMLIPTLFENDHEKMILDQASDIEKPQDRSIIKHQTCDQKSKPNNIFISSKSKPTISTRAPHRNSRLSPDVGIEYIWDIEADILYKDHLPGFDVNLNVTVRNYGDDDITTPFEIIFNVSDDGYPQYFNESKKTFPICIGQTVFKAQTSYNVSWNWTPPKPEHMPPGSKNDYSKGGVVFIANFMTTLDGDINPGNDKKSKEIIVIKPPYRVRVRRGWYVQNGSSWEWIGREPYLFKYVKGKANYFELKFTIENLGEATYIDYSVIAPTDWTVITPSRQIWQANSNSYNPPKNLTLTVFPSINPKYLPYNKDMIITLKAICESYPDIYDTTNFVVRVDYIPNPVIIPPSPPVGESRLYLNPGISFLNSTLKNMGNGADNFEIRATVGLTLATGWSALVHSGTYTRVLNRGESWNITLKLTVPIMATAESMCPVIITATSLKYPNHPDGKKNTTFVVISQKFRDARFTGPLPDEIIMAPNSEVFIDLNITNTGNALDNSIEFNVSKKPNDEWEVFIDTSNIPHEGLMRNEEGTIQLIIKTPKFVLADEYQINITVLSEDEPKDEVAISVRVEKVYGVILNCNYPSKSGNTTEKIFYHFNLKNIGNANDTFDIEYDFITPEMIHSDWKVEISVSSITLLPLEGQKVQVSIIIPKDAMADTDFDIQNQQGYKFMLRANSQNETSKLTERKFEVFVNPIYDFNLSKEVDKKTLIHSDKIGSAEYSFSLTNLGNDIDWYNVDCDTKYDWFIISFTQRRIPPMVTQVSIITFDSPGDIPVGEYEFVIQISSGNVPTLTRELVLTVEVLVFDLAVTEIQISNQSFEKATLLEGEQVELRIKLENLGEINYSSESFGKPLVVVLTEGSNYIGEANISFLPSKTSGQNSSAWLTIPWSIGKVKTYELNVEVDPYKDLPDSDRDNNELNRPKNVKPKEQSKSKEKDEGFSLSMIILFIIIIIIVISIIIWLIAYSSKVKKKKLEKKGKYKPYEDTEKADFEKDREKDFEEEPEGGVLAKSGERSELDEKRDKFLKERLSLVQMQPVSTMKPVKMMKPIPTSKPIIDEKRLKDDE